MRGERRARERGSATLYAVALGMVLVLAGAAELGVSAAVIARHRADAAADLAALAAADRAALGAGRGAACGAAERVAETDGARVARCAAAPRGRDGAVAAEAEVEAVVPVRVPGPPGAALGARGRARAAVTGLGRDLGGSAVVGGLGTGVRRVAEVVGGADR
ncbi:hypothetical protein BIV57_20305 [Mangrovactinospora gilvigrisea]|uniref:Flp pilus-assembly TadG-like N-terminal domain-containing protein n=1 Tax=Mangrovactinospora gilvigrisea TaxID=1428644 RepID=A0A1J7C7Q2_9ACTN|nr:Rv3654c family TadE-like protein [Mangrovactinospora gilvigrisea]OIV35674.1 hypothetical protein BIV57_20305 [Mangrovactinospora gilvigrisea]